ncbi:FtsH protease activity modulator HflK [Verminephrobacter eiseniae]|uniref:FtsH protease activity modulator HflK n=1 Tax=Verminephrobacter eiseniae TaxID=364317 RepID=UPI0010F1CA92|nr:FtsH protease activity modulator HflK [Verminephrobacter eiseniae]KAB7616423.1 FtsH protease activity modulator HflK [Verminephrobacter sp. Larva24]MCW5232913.1 FtsH protease activity modulator HflK [Verminephrobacter eiseniae]MCW5261081.1 FtsH protease activity modulator HflK [Verminephrobacter eiseniae]MCW5295533.1 FtsH protease activity modulator HflK [Verminephrobacter eiseniae]MCW8184458.1 FtsH protease activity modulator HflK [Verminephrobacter eiseniae]
MNFQNRPLGWALLPERIRGMFNLNDPRWGRGEDKSDDAAGPPDDRPGTPPAGQRGDDKRPGRPGRSGNTQPPDLDEIMRDLNRKLGGLFGGKNGAGRGPGSGGNGGGSGGGFQPDMKSAGVGVGLIAGIVFVIWMGTGFFIVQEGQQAVITQFGMYKSTVGAGFNWRLPYPIERHELVFVTQIRSEDVGRDNIIKSTGLRESAMLTADENIVEIKFAVQYRLNDARAWLFESKNPRDAVVQAAETAVREVVGKMRMDTALAEERDQIAPRVRTLMQTILDRYKVGVEVVGINLQQGGVKPPEQVQASFDDVLKATQERERAKNEAQAYANDVIPRAVGSASRLSEEADAYKARIVAQAQGDAQRFSSVLAEYQKAPQVTRDRMYLDAMQQVYGNVTKVLIESRQGTNLLYLPLDKILRNAGAETGTQEPSAATSSAAPSSGIPAIPPGNLLNDPRARDSNRTRERESR